MFWGKKRVGGGGEGKALPAPPPTTALWAHRENKRLRSDNGVSVIGLDIFSFKILIRFGGSFLDNGLISWKYICAEYNECALKFNATTVNCKHRSHTHDCR